MKASPKKLTVCKFGVTLYPNKVYEVRNEGCDRFSLKVDENVFVIFEKKHLNFKNFTFSFLRYEREIEPCLLDSEGTVVSLAGKRWFTSHRTDAEYYGYLDFAKNHKRNKNLFAASDVFWPSTSLWKKSI